MYSTVLYWSCGWHPVQPCKQPSNEAGDGICIYSQGKSTCFFGRCQQSFVQCSRCLSLDCRICLLAIFSLDPYSSRHLFALSLFRSSATSTVLHLFAPSPTGPAPLSLNGSASSAFIICERQCLRLFVISGGFRCLGTLPMACHACNIITSLDPRNSHIRTMQPCMLDSTFHGLSSLATLAADAPSGPWRDLAVSQSPLVHHGG